MTLIQSKILYKRIGKFTGVTNLLFSLGVHLTPQAKWIYTTLSSFRNSGTGRTYPSYEKIMERSGMSRNAVAKGLKELENFHWVTKQKNFGKSTNYNISSPVWVDGNCDLPIPTKEMASDWKKNQSLKRKNKNPEIVKKVKLLKTAGEVKK